MIPASYLYKDVYNCHWGHPANRWADPVDCEPRGPDRGHMAGLAGLLAAVMPLQLERGRRLARGW